MSHDLCAARKPGFDSRPMIGANSQPCMLAAGHAGDHVNAVLIRWENLSEETWCDAEMPADLAETLNDDDSRNPCFMDAGHFGECHNGYVAWPARTAPVPRTELLLALMDNITAEDADMLRPFLRAAEWLRPDARDAELVEDARAMLSECFGGDAA